MQEGDYESALFHICPAIDATAAAEYGKSGRKSYKDFIHANMDLITDVAFGRQMLNLNIQLNHSNHDLPMDANGLCAFQDIVYHLVRCSLMHGQQIPQNITFIPEKRIECNHGDIKLPAPLIYGFIIAVVCSPANAHEQSHKEQWFNIGDFHMPTSKLWGRRAEMLWLLDAEKEARAQIIAMQQRHEAEERLRRDQEETDDERYEGVG